MRRLVIALWFCLFTTKAKSATCPGANCNSTLSVYPQVQQYTSPCYPNHYENNEFCSHYLESYNTNYTQMVFVAFKVEAWHDYLKLYGPDSFIVFADADSNHLYVTGYPNGNITAQFITDGSTTYGGFNANLSSISGNEFFSQYDRYGNESAVLQILDSPLFISSSENPESVGGLDVMFINVPNTTNSPAEIWSEYTGLKSNATQIQSFDITPNSFSVNWTAVDGAVRYNVLLAKSNGNSVDSFTGIVQPTANFTGLPSGTSFSIKVTALDKQSRTANITGRAETAVTSPANVSILTRGVTTMTLEWSAIDGAVGYKVQVIGGSSQNETAARANISNLAPGRNYTFAVVAIFEVGRSAAVTVNGVTELTSNSSAVWANNVKTNGFTVHWRDVQATEHYTIAIRQLGGGYNTSISIANSSQQHQVNGLISGTEYSIIFGVVGRDASATLNITVSTVPGKVLNLLVKSTTKNVTASWDSVRGATSYILKIEKGVAVTNTVNNAQSGGTIMALLPGTAYNLSVAATNGGEEARLRFTTKLDSPTVTMSSVSTSSFLLNWTAVEGAEQYLYNCSNVHAGHQIASKSETSKIMSGLTAGTNYSCYVSAATPDITSEAGTATVITALIPSGTTLWTAMVTSNGFIVHWDSIPRANKYILEVKEVGGGIISTYPVNNTLQQHNVSGLESGTPHSIKLSVTGPDASDSISNTTSTVPEKVSNLYVLSTAKTVTVKWDSVHGAKSYVLKIVNDGATVKTVTDAISGVKITEAIRPGTQYIVFVAAANNGEEAMLRFTTKLESPVVSFRSVSASGFTLAWTAVEGAEQYVYHCASIHARNQTVTKAETSKEISGLNSATNYICVVFAQNANATSAMVSATVTTVPGRVANLAVDAISPKTVTLRWDQVRGATSYVVKIKRGVSIKTIKNARSGEEITAVLTPGTAYDVSVAAANGGEESTIKITTTLEDTIVKIKSVSKTRFLLTWTTVEGATGYNYSCRLPDKAPEFISVGSSETSKEITGLNPSTTYNCYVFPKTEDFSGGIKSDTATTTVEECEKKPCLNGGTCKSGETGFTCTCTAGYEGNTCQTEKDFCKSNPCKENTDCTNDAKNARYKCSCRAGFTGSPQTGCVAFCNSGSVIALNKTYNFNFTFDKGTVYSNEICKESGRSKASVLCKMAEDSDRAKFQSNTLVVTECTLKIANVTVKVEKNSTTEALENQSGQLEILTSGTSVTKEEVTEVADYIADVSEIGKTKEGAITETVLRGLVNTADNLISTNSISQASTQVTTPGTGNPGPKPEQPKPIVTKEEKRIKQKILKSLTDLAKQVVVPKEKKEVVIETKTMVVKVVDRPKNETTSATFAPVFATEKPTTDNTSPVTETVQPLHIIIPAETIKKAENHLQSDKSNEFRLSFFLHKDDSLFPSDDASKKPEMIIAANLGTDVKVKDLTASQNVQFSYNNIEAEKGDTKTFNKLVMRRTSFQCSYWDVDNSEWSTKGCWTDRENKGGHQAACKCNHLTNYALIVATNEVPADVHLDTFSVVGIGLSVIGLVLTIIIHCIKEEVRKRGPAQILLHICSNLLVTYIIFAAGVSSAEEETPCIVITAFLQYFFLTSWSWMTVYAYDMYGNLVVVFNKSRSRYMTKCTIFAYGLPLVITILDVSISVGYVDAQELPPELPDDQVKVSAYKAENMCWLQDHSLYFGFLLPIGLMLLFNIFVYCMVFRTLLQRNKTVQSSAKKAGAKDNFMISITITASTGLTWAVGYLMLLSTDETYQLVLSWVFSVLNTLQGVIIFLTTCVRHENMRKIWWLPIRRRFAGVGGRIALMSPKRRGFSLGNTSEGGGFFLSTTGGDSSTKVTGLHSFSKATTSDIDGIESTAVHTVEEVAPSETDAKIATKDTATTPIKSGASFENGPVNASADSSDVEKAASETGGQKSTEDTAMHSVKEATVSETGDKGSNKDTAVYSTEDVTAPETGESSSTKDAANRSSGEAATIETGGENPTRDSIHSTKNVLVFESSVVISSQDDTDILCVDDPAVIETAM